MDRFTATIIGSPVATFICLATIATSIVAFQNEYLKQKFMLRPYSLVERKTYYTVLTSGLIHANWWHLIMNMIAFYFFAFSLEHDMTYLQVIKLTDGSSETAQTVYEIIGHAKFLAIYLISLVLADITTIIKYRNVPSYASLGASGAISGVLISAVILTPAMGNQIYIWGIPGWAFALLYILGSYVNSLRSRDNVAHEAHLWGALAGLIFTPIFFPHDSWKFVEDVAKLLG